MREYRAPQNTKKEAQESPIIPLMEMMVFGSSAAIERQEAHGQQSFVTSDTLPTQMSGRRQDDAKVILESWGIRFIGPVDGDPLFQYVELPEGWRKVPTDHVMNSQLLDEHGRERATIFYKAAHYDRKARLHVSCRYDVVFDYERFDRDQVGIARVMEGDTCLYEVEIPAGGKECYLISNEAEEAAILWLQEHYPDWQNPGAYWE